MSLKTSSFVIALALAIGVLTGVVIAFTPLKHIAGPTMVAVVIVLTVGLHMTMRRPDAKQ